MCSVWSAIYPYWLTTFGFHWLHTCFVVCPHTFFAYLIYDSTVAHIKTRALQCTSGWHRYCNLPVNFLQLLEVFCTNAVVLGDTMTSTMSFAAPTLVRWQSRLEFGVRHTDPGARLLLIWHQLKVSLLMSTWHYCSTLSICMGPILDVTLIRQLNALRRPTSKGRDILRPCAHHPMCRWLGNTGNCTDMKQLADAASDTHQAAASVAKG